MVFSGTVTSDFLKFLPTNLDNKEKLIDHSAADFNTFREALIKYVQAVYPLDYNNFTESDFGMMLIELMAAVGHIQSIKSDYLVNENYIKTARSKDSVKKLLELVGIRMKGPISAAANAKITVTVPAGMTGISSIVIPISERVVSITSPEDNGSLSYTLYKINNDGTVDLESNTTDLTIQVSGVGNTIVLTDIVLLEGALVLETGSFQSPDTIKSIRLSQFPHIEKSSQVFIDGTTLTNGVYKEEENLFYASGATDKVYEVVTDENFAATLVFGDSTIGLSPAVGDNYTVTYRVGGGSRGNINEDIINAPITIQINGTTIQNVDGVLENTTKATGGADSESIAHAKRYAPLVFRSQDRLVTLGDYKAFTNNFISSYGSTGKSNGIVRRAFSSANFLDFFVLEKASDTQLRRATPEFKRQLLNAISEKKMLTDEPVVLDGLIRTLDIIVTIRLDSKLKRNEAEIRNKTRTNILDYFNVDNTEFGQSFVPQDLVKSILDIPEIRYAEVDNISSTIKIEFNEIIQLNNLTINVVYI